MGIFFHLALFADKNRQTDRQKERQTVEIGVPPFPVPVPDRSVLTSKTAEKRKFRFMPKNGTVSVYDVSFH